MLRVSGHQVIDGVDSIKLTIRFTIYAVFLGPPERKSSVVETDTIWVSPRTFLPIQMVTGAVGGFTSPIGSNAPLFAKGTRLAGLRTEFRWLPLTRASLAGLTVPIPPGFRHVSG